MNKPDNNKVQPDRDQDVTAHGRRAPLIEDDTEGHAYKSGRADAESSEGDEDTEGHAAKFKGADAESVEGDEDTEGHATRPGR